MLYYKATWLIKLQYIIVYYFYHYYHKLIGTHDELYFIHHYKPNSYVRPQAT